MINKKIKSLVEKEILKRKNTIYFVITRFEPPMFLKNKDKINIINSIEFEEVEIISQIKNFDRIQKLKVSFLKDFINFFNMERVKENLIELDIGNWFSSSILKLKYLKNLTLRDMICPKISSSNIKKLTLVSVWGYVNLESILGFGNTIEELMFDKVIVPKHSSGLLKNTKK